MIECGNPILHNLHIIHYPIRQVQCITEKASLYDSTMRFLVHKVSPSTDDLPDKQPWCSNIRNSPEVDLLHPRINDSADNSTNESAVYGDAAVPYFEYLREVVLIILPLKSYIIN